MNTTKRWLFLSAGLMVLALIGFRFSLGVEQAGGSFYQPGSSFRADQEGTRILYESLEAYPAITVQQNAESWSRLLEDLDPRQTLILQLNTPSYWRMEAEEVLDFLEAGGRILFTPPRLVGGFGEEVFAEIEAQEEEAQRTSEEEARQEQAREWLEWDGLELQRIHDPDVHPLTPTLNGQDTPPPVVEIKVRQVFEETGDWEIVAEADGWPVLLRKTRGDGEFLLLADESLLVNGRLFANPPTEWISWLLGESTHVVFQEAHLGMGNPQSLTALMWRHRIGGLLPALAIPFLLLCWRAFFPFLPPLPMEEEPDQGPQGRMEGTRDLFARYIEPKQILRECLNRWGDHIQSSSKNTRQQRALHEARQLLADLPAKEAGDLAGLYTRLDKLLNQKRKRT